MELERIHDFCWRIPKRGAMRVEGIVYASRRMIEALRRDESLQQVANVATLPGIVKASLAMPDIHWGYGLPIGGVAAFDAEDGVISPGGVGFDVNCLPNHSEILDYFGCRRSIGSFVSLPDIPRLPCLEKEMLASASPLFVLERSSGGRLTRLVTESWKELHATPDHPVLTPSGMKEIGQVMQGDKVAVYHFEGVPFEEPSGDVIVSEDAIVALAQEMGKGTAGSALAQILKHLRGIGLFPLRYHSPQLPHLLRIIGFLFGDGTLYVEKQSKRVKAAFYGKSCDLEHVREDIRAAGFTPSPIHARHRRHEIATTYGLCRFDHREESFSVASSAFGLLMLALGVPLGRKAETPYGVPLWIRKAPRWQQRLYLAALFGAELNSPRTMTGHGYNFYCPVLDMNKVERLKDDGREFLNQLSNMIEAFGVEVKTILERKEYINRNSEVSYRLRLVLSSADENLVSLYSKIGFEYHHLRAARAAQAVAYLKCKRQHLELRQQLADNIRQYAMATGTDGKEVHAAFDRWAPNHQFVDRCLKGCSARVRVSQGFPTFEEFVRASASGLGESGCVWEEVVAKEEMPFVGRVYDLSMDHPSHNFIADGFVVSNCGVRLLRTELGEEDLRPRVREVVHQLFRDIPTGVGSHHTDFRLGSDDLQGVLNEGAGWAVAQGFGDANDLAHIESGGALPGADPEAVSGRAKERGRSQLGTLGSGNHFVELQVVEEIFDEAAANAMGLFRGQIAVMIHTGSRGLGHQVCQDHVDLMLAASRKYRIEVPDRQLCCAPIGSPEGKRYFGAMAAAANFAFANRQMIMHWTRLALERALGISPRDMGLGLVYDVAHNIAKFEEHRVGGRSRRLCVHRKGATRSFPPHHPEIPAAYREIGQPVLIPGDMGRYSFVLVGQEQAMEESFGSTCHGAGRLMSRQAAKKACRGRNIVQELSERGVVVQGASRETVVEEVPEAYKDVAEVVEVVQQAGLSRKVAKLRPIGVIKG